MAKVKKAPKKTPAKKPALPSAIAFTLRFDDEPDRPFGIRRTDLPNWSPSVIYGLTHRAGECLSGSPEDVVKELIAQGCPRQLAEAAVAAITPGVTPD